MSGEELRTAPLTADEALRRSGFSEYRKVGTTRISDITFPPGTVYETPEGLHTDDEETRCAFDVQGGIYPIRESVFRSVYALAAPSTPEPIGGRVCPACGLSWWTVGDDGYDCNHGAAPSTPEPSGLPVGAILASALMAANYPGDSGEDVDRLIAELAKRGYAVVPSTPEPSGLREALKDAVSILGGGHRGYVGDHYIREVQVNEATVERLREVLRAAPSTEPALDVAALADWFCMNLDHPDHDPFLQPDHCDIGLADAKDAVAHIAAERARLAESQP